MSFLTFGRGPRYTGVEINYTGRERSEREHTMQRTSRPVVTVLIAACASVGLLAPSAIADQPTTSPKSPNAATPAVPATPPTETTPATPATPASPADKKKPTNAERRRGYGVLCKDQSKKHLDGQKGTPFSQCVTALAKIDRGETTSPKKACKGLSKKHVKGQKGTPYSRCVVAAAKQREKAEVEAPTPAAPAQS